MGKSGNSMSTWKRSRGPGEWSEQHAGYRVRVSEDPSQDDFWTSQIDSCRVQAACDADAAILKNLVAVKSSWSNRLEEKLSVAEPHSASVDLASIGQSPYDLLLQQSLKQRVSIEYFKASTILVCETVDKMAALLGSSAWASQEVAGEGGKFCFVDARNANNKPRPLRLKLVPDAAGFYKATFQCFVKFDFPPAPPAPPAPEPEDFNGWKVGAHSWHRCLGLSGDRGGEYLVEWKHEEPSWVTKEDFGRWSDRTVVFTLAGLGLRGLEGRQVEVFWSPSGCLHKGMITNLNRDVTFVIVYRDGDGDRRLNLLGGSTNTYMSNWGFEHVLYEWSCLPH